jgi:hypothetical protein
VFIVCMIEFYVWWVFYVKVFVESKTVRWLPKLLHMCLCFGDENGIGGTKSCASRTLGKGKLFDRVIRLVTNNSNKEYLNFASNLIFMGFETTAVGTHPCLT